MRLGRLILAIAMLAAPQSLRAEGLANHAITYRSIIHGLPSVMTSQVGFKSWTLEGCKKWMTGMTLSVNIRVERFRITQRVEIGAEEELEGAITLANFRTSGDLTNAERRIKATYPGAGNRPYLDVVQPQGGRVVDLPADILRPRETNERTIAELLKGSRDFTIASIDPSVAGGWVAIRYSVLDRWPYPETRLPAQISAALPGRSWNVRMQIAGDKSGQPGYMQIHESGIITRMASEYRGMLIEHIASKLELLDRPGC